MNVRMLLGMTVIAVASFGLAGCSDPCGDVVDCCKAGISADATAEQKTEAEKQCDVFADADSDACQALIDAYKPPAGADVPAECQF